MRTHQAHTDDARLTSHISKTIKKFKGAWISVAVFSAAINLLMLGPSLYMLQVYDRVLSSGNVFTLLMLSLLVGGLLAMSGALDYARSLVLVHLGTRFDELLRGGVYAASFERGLTGKAANSGQVMADLNTMRNFLTGSAVFALFDAPWFPLFLLVLFLFDFWFGALALSGAALLIGLTLINDRLTRAPLAEAGTFSANAAVEAEGQLRNVDTIQAMGMLTQMSQRWQTVHRQQVHRLRDAGRRAALIATISKTVRMGLQSLALGLGAWLVLENRISPGMMIAGSILMGRALSPIDQVTGAWKQWSGTRLASARLQSLLDSYPSACAKHPLPPFKGALRLEGVTAVPPGSSLPSIINLSLELAPGQILGVVGPSGSGKSSLARLLVGVWHPRLGAVKLDGADLRLWDRENIGKTTGYLSQDVELFAGTVSENISRFTNDDDHQALAQRVIEAAKLANAHELIVALPKGYDTPLGMGGLGLSGGQRQRVALARALFGAPRLVVLDEPNSNLDEAGEQALLDAVRQLSANGTSVVIVTHRAKVLSATTHTLVLGGGKIQRFGPTRDVLTNWSTSVPNAGQPMSRRFVEGTA